MDSLNNVHGLIYHKTKPNQNDLLNNLRNVDTP